MALTLTIDMGTTNLKVGLVDEEGKIRSLHVAAIATVSREAGTAEHDPAALRKLVMSLCKKVLKENNREEVTCLVASTYQFGLMLLDEQRKPLTGTTLLSDIRSQHRFSDFVDFYRDVDIYHRTGCPLISQYVLPRLYYFLREYPALLKKAKFFTDGKSFLFEWLTGEWATDISTAVATQFYNIQEFRWDQELLSRLHLSPEQFPAPENGTKFMAPLKREIARELGLNKDVQVVLGVYDGAALGVGLSGLEPHVGIVNLGTTAMLRVPGAVAVWDKNENKRIQAYALHENFFLNGGALNNAALPLNWMKDRLYDFDLQDPGLLQITHEPPLICLPYLTGERDSLTGPFASGVFFGVRRHHGRIDFARSVLEGVAFSMRYLYEALAENNLPVKEIRMGGGGVNIEAWPQIFADVLGVPVTLSSGKEMALVGNAMLGFVAGGKYKSLDEAARYMLKDTRRVEPVAESVKIRDQQYRFFKKLRENLAPLYEEHSGLGS